MPRQNASQEPFACREKNRITVRGAISTTAPCLLTVSVFMIPDSFEGSSPNIPLLVSFRLQYRRVYIYSLQGRPSERKNVISEACMEASIESTYCHVTSQTSSQLISAAKLRRELLLNFHLTSAQPLSPALSLLLTFLHRLSTDSLFFFFDK